MRKAVREERRVGALQGEVVAALIGPIVGRLGARRLHALEPDLQRATAQGVNDYLGARPVGVERRAAGEDRRTEQLGVQRQHRIVANCERALVRRLGFGNAALLLEDLADVLLRLEEIRVMLDRAPVQPQRLVPLALHLEHAGQVVRRRRRARIDLQRAAEGGRRLGELPVFVERQPEAVDDLGVVRAQPACRVVVPHGAGEVAGLAQQQGQVGVGADRVRIDGECAPVLVGRLRAPSQAMLHSAEVGERVDVRRRETQRLLIVRHRLDESPRLGAARCRCDTPARPPGAVLLSRRRQRRDRSTGDRRRLRGAWSPVTGRAVASLVVSTSSTGPVGASMVMMRWISSL